MDRFIVTNAPDEQGTFEITAEYQKGDKGEQGVQGVKGEKGDPGQPHNLATVTTGGNQLFNKNDYINNQAITAAGTLSNTTDARSSLIVIDSSKPYTALSGMTITGSSKRWRFEDSVGGVIAGQFGLIDTPTKILANPPGATRIRVNFKSAADAASVADKVMVNYGLDALPHEEYGVVKTYVKGIDSYPLIVEVTALTKPIKTYGDSTSFGQDLATPATTAWPTLLAARLSVPFINRGSSGQYAEEITARLGGIVPKIKITGGVIPISGAAAVTYQDLNPIRSGSVTKLMVRLVTPDGTQINGELSSGGFTAIGLFSPVTVGTNNVDVYSVAGREDAITSLVLIGQGINNEPFIVDGSQTIEDIKRFYRSATSVCKDFFVWGVLDRGISEQSGTVIGDYIKALELWLSQQYGTKYIPVRQYLASAQALEDAKLYNPSFASTTNDTAAVTAKTTPPSFRSAFSSVHLNEMGHWLQALFMYKWLRYYM